jgi:tetratricopeptide (TPR) repeat protein
MTAQELPTTTQSRVMRVFISSTFRDMQAERDELVKVIFPQLRKLCERRGVAWGEVDLRWGISDEQKSEGMVLPICLDEIQRCRPYFIGLLGERYGFIPHEISSALIEREPWLEEYSGQSVTELEILHGVLNDPKMAEHAFFYFRDPGFLDAIRPEQRAAFVEGAAPEEMEKYGTQEAQQRAEQRKQKLAALKDRIRQSGFPVHEKYKDPKEFGQYVLQDLTAIINRLYPEGSQPDPFDREAAEQMIFARSRTSVYIGRPKYFDELDAHVRSQGQPLVILGESGSGKSALLANWAIQHRTRYPDDLVIMHFIGATPGSADWVAMLRRILEEFRRKFKIREEIPEKPDALRGAFANWLYMAAAHGRVVLIIDALNQLDDRDGASDLVWLPAAIPENVRILLSTLPGRSLDELRKRGWPVLTIEPLQIEERKQLIKKYLALSTKTLDTAHMEGIANAPQCHNPLYLRLLLDDLRLFGIYEKLGEQIDKYLKAPTIPALFALILARCEQDYEQEKPGLVHDSMCLLWAARRGLSEAELLELLGTNEQPLPHIYWSVLYLALEQSFISRSGLIGFSHNYLRQAVQDYFLPEKGMQKSAHLRLADYFEAQSGQSLRYLDELPWQLLQAQEWKRLNDLLGNPLFLKTAWDSNRYEVKEFWAQVEANSPYRLIDAYQPVIQNPDKNQDVVKCVSFLLGDTGYTQEALNLRAHLVEYYRQTDDKANLEASLGDQANILFDRGDLDGALELHKKEQAICRELGDMDGLSASLGNQALILQARGDLDGAMALHQEAVQIARALGNKDGLQTSLGHQANLLRAHGKLEDALELVKEKIRICKEIGNKDGLGVAFGQEGLILYERGNLDEALELFKEEEKNRRELGNRDGLQVALGNQALILRDQGNLDGAMALHKEEERISREIGNKVGLSTSLGSQATILYDRGQMDGAMQLYEEDEKICREIGYKEGLRVSLSGQANILRRARGDLNGAMRLYKEVEQICREIGNKGGLARMLGNQGLILQSWGRNDEALSMHRQAEKLLRELGNDNDLAVSLLNQAVLLAAKGKRSEAHGLIEECDAIAAKHGYRNLANQISSIKLKYRI